MTEIRTSLKTTGKQAAPEFVNLADGRVQVKWRGLDGVLVGSVVFASKADAVAHADALKIFAVPAPSPPAPAATTKRMIHLGPTWDPFLVAAQQANFEAKISALVGFKGTPQWEVYKHWNLAVYAYLNIWSDPGVSYAVYQNDTDGAPLYNPYANNERRSMDLKSATYKAGFVAAVKAMAADGAAGVFVDDVNLDHLKNFRRADGTNPRMDLLTGAFYTGSTGVGWAALLADFLTDVRAQVHASYPNFRFVLNTVIWDLQPNRWTDGRFVRLIDACDYMCIEHGATDPGLTNGVGSDSNTWYSLRDLNCYIAAVHARGRSVMKYVMGSAVDTAAGRKYEMAHYLDQRGQDDMIGLWNEHVRWPVYDPVYDTDLGAQTSRTDAGQAGATIFSTYVGGSVSYQPVTFTSATIT